MSCFVFFLKENIINLNKTAAGAFGASKISFTYAWQEQSVICQPETGGHDLYMDNT